MVFTTPTASNKARQDGDSPDIQNSSEESLEEQFLHLQMEELDQAKARSTGKQREGVVQDFDLALEIFQSELISLQTFRDDRRMLKSVATALIEDNAIIATLISQEEAARNDRNIALAIQQQSHGHGTTKANAVAKDVGKTKEDPTDASHEKNMLRLALKENYQYFTQDRLPEHPSTNPSIPYAESSTIAAKRASHSIAIQASVQVEKQECVVCTDTFSIFDLTNLPCGHDYCYGCISRLFADSMIDESLFPPRCCRTNITLEHVRMFLNADIAVEFGQRKEELETANKTYCRMSECSKFIPKASVDNEIGHCTACGATTCCICKGAPHVGSDCPEDHALRMVLETAEAAGWKRCCGCLRLVELTIGCNHIICRCGAEFCYECGARWHTCQCEQWREDRLYGRARAIQERDTNQADEAPDTQLNRIVENLRVNHECTHENWRYIPGSHQCEECTHMLPKYIFECRRCQLRACWRCRRNRL